jgi:hypothetical protein
MDPCRTHAPLPLPPEWGSAGESTIFRCVPVRTAVSYSDIAVRIHLKKSQRKKKEKSNKMCFCRKKILIETTIRIKQNSK